LMRSCLRRIGHVSACPETIYALVRPLKGLDCREPVAAP
jgi:hypothetical protein